MSLQDLEEFDGEGLGVGADGDHGEEVIGADADYRDVAGILIDGEKKIFLGIEPQGGGSLARGDREAFAGFAIQAAIGDVDGNDAIGGGI